MALSCSEPGLVHVVWAFLPYLAFPLDPIHPSCPEPVSVQHRAVCYQRFAPSVDAFQFIEDLIIE